VNKNEGGKKSMKSKKDRMKRILIILAVVTLFGGGLIGLAIAKTVGFSLNSAVSFPVDI
jgi:hypothetical protein